MEYKTKDSELNSALIRYICQCQATGDFKSLENIGIDDETLKLIQNMTVQEALHTANMRTTFIKTLSIDSGLLSNRLKHAKREEKTNRSIDNLISHGAPIELIQDLTGITAKEFAERRKMQKVVFRGRTQMPTEEQEAIIIDVWKKYLFKTKLKAEEWIDIAVQTKLPIRLITKVIYDTQGDHVNEQIH